MPAVAKPESSRVCIVCGCGPVSDESEFGKFIQGNDVVDAHLTCAAGADLDAVDAWAESLE